MKLLDRYVLGSFLRNYLMSFFVLVGFYVLLDMLFNFDKLIIAQAREATRGLETVFGMLKLIGDWYFYQVFVIFAQLSGIIPVVAAAFTLMRMSRFNELSAMLSAGVPLLRVALPIILAAVVLNGLLLVDQELLIPQMIPKLSRRYNEVGQSSGGAFTISSMKDEKGRILVAARYIPGAMPRMRKVRIVDRDDALLPTSMLVAEDATWEPDARDPWGGHWRFTGAVRTNGLLPEQTPTTQPTAEVYASIITPEEINLYRSNDYVQLLSTERINQLLDPARSSSYGSNQLLRVKHARFTQPLMNIIVLLLAIPCVLTREPGRLKAAAAKCLILTGMAMGGVFVSQMLAVQPPTPDLAQKWPAIMAWVPIFSFGPLAVWLLDRIQT